MIEVAAPMEARAQPALPQGQGWWFEPKWDGFRCVAFLDGADVRLMARSGKPLGRYFPEVVETLARLKTPPVVLDGELLAGAGANGAFETLQMRLHPAESRIRRLAKETPATFMLFDMLQDHRGSDLRAAPLSVRRPALETWLDTHPDPGLKLSPGTAHRATAERWLTDPEREGVVAKRWDGPYQEGERAMVKVKRARTADCVVGGFRYATGGEKLVGSLLLGLYDDAGLLDHVGFTSGLSAIDKPALTRRLEALKGEPGFTGDRPGGPSRWATERSVQWTPLRPELVVEVSFDHVSAGRFRHGTRLVRLRPDKAPEQCRKDQLA